MERGVSTLATAATLFVALFAWVSIQQVQEEQSITREGQITDRYNAAVDNLGNASLDVRLGGIYALQRIMQDSSRDQPTVISVLSAYIRAHATQPKKPVAEPEPPPRDVGAALTVLGKRDVSHDGAGFVDLAGAYLPGADLHGADLHGADLSYANLSGAKLVDAKLQGVDLAFANLVSAELTRANMTKAKLSYAILVDAELTGANLTKAKLNSDPDSTDLHGSHLSGANLSGAKLSHADLYDTILTHVNLTGADLSYANLSRADLRHTDLAKANLSHANLTGAKRH
ncbi:pentapeptide repeat-containing protein [Streptomyces mirabilis]|uniref:pentapeptide repeat-containing protein n=1 Tax=Streptomyces mirabilis TaxID=68239 RepID=UPI0033B17BC4